MITKEVINNELYVYYNGILIYKRWIKLGYGYVFDPIFGTFKSDESDNIQKK